MYLPANHHIYYINKLMIVCMRTLQLKGLYQFAQVKLYKPHLSRYFENNPELVRKALSRLRSR